MRDINEVIQEVNAGNTRLIHMAKHTLLVLESFGTAWTASHSAEISELTW
jgi:hypothetical protein